jgi:hypothetical protein
MVEKQKILALYYIKEQPNSAIIRDVVIFSKLRELIIISGFLLFLSSLLKTQILGGQSQKFALPSFP